MRILDRKNRLRSIWHDISIFSFIFANILYQILYRIITYHDHTQIWNRSNVQLYTLIHTHSWKIFLQYRWWSTLINENSMFITPTLKLHSFYIHDNSIIFSKHYFIPKEHSLIYYLRKENTWIVSRCSSFSQSMTHSREIFPSHQVHTLTINILMIKSLYVLRHKHQYR